MIDPLILNLVPPKDGIAQVERDPGLKKTDDSASLACVLDSCYNIYICATSFMKTGWSMALELRIPGR